MALRMVGLARDPKTGSWKSRKVIPRDVRVAYGTSNETPTWVAPPHTQAKAAYAARLTGVEARVERLRQFALAVPITLTHRELHALAGSLYAQQVRAYEDDPGDPDGWDAARDQIEPEDADAAYQAHIAGERYSGPMKRVPWLTNQLQALLEGEGWAQRHGRTLDG